MSREVSLPQKKKCPPFPLFVSLSLSLTFSLSLSHCVSLSLPILISLAVAEGDFGMRIMSFILLCSHSLSLSPSLLSLSLSPSLSLPLSLPLSLTLSYSLSNHCYGCMTNLSTLIEMARYFPAVCMSIDFRV